MTNHSHAGFPLKPAPSAAMRMTCNERCPLMIGKWLGVMACLQRRIDDLWA